MKIATHRVGQTEIARLTTTGFRELITEILRGQKLVHIATVNAEYLVRAERDADFQALLQQTFNLADGIGPIWAANFLEKARGQNFLQKIWLLIQTGATLVLAPKRARQIFPERLSGADLWQEICSQCEQTGQTVFLAGWGGGLSSFAEVRAKLQDKFPQLQVAGCFGEIPEIDAALEKVNPAVLFCGLGMPKQDFWLAEKLAKTGARLGMGVGGSFDFLTGRQKRAPQIFQKLGCEWLWRLCTRPNRWRRIWTATGTWVGLIWGKAR